MKRYTMGDYQSAVEKLAPFSLQESWDNAGLLVGSPDQEVTRALVALDATGPVIREAESLGAQLVVTHHPVIFDKLASIPAESPVYAAIRAGVGVLCAHTNLDIARGGVNDCLARRLGLENTVLLKGTSSAPWLKVVTFVPIDAAEAVYEAMSGAGAGRQGNYAGAAYCSEGEGRFLPLEGANPAVGKAGALERVSERRIEMLVHPGRLSGVIEALRRAHPYEEPAYDVLETQFARHWEGLGRVGDLAKSLTPEAFAVYVRQRVETGGLRYVPGEGPITRVAVCGGAGGSFLARAKALGAQALVAGEVKHSHLLEAGELGLTLVEAGHYATEAVVLPVLLERLRETLPGAEIARAKSCGDPAKYVTI